MLRARKKNASETTGAARCYSVILGRTFHSKDEKDYAEHLADRQKKGEISDLQFQKRVVLKDSVLVVPMLVDFCYHDNRLGLQVWDEFKGLRTTHWKQVKSLWAKNGLGIYQVTVRKRNSLAPWVQTDVIYPQQAVEGGTTGAIIAGEYAWKLGKDGASDLARQINEAIGIAVQDALRERHG